MAVTEFLCKLLPMKGISRIYIYEYQYYKFYNGNTHKKYGISMPRLPQNIQGTTSCSYATNQQYNFRTLQKILKNHGYSLYIKPIKKYGNYTNSFLNIYSLQCHAKSILNVPVVSHVNQPSHPRMGAEI